MSIVGVLSDSDALLSVLPALVPLACDCVLSIGWQGNGMLWPKEVCIADLGFDVCAVVSDLQRCGEG